jgi:hypothetical protein
VWPAIVTYARALGLERRAKDVSLRNTFASPNSSGMPNWTCIFRFPQDLTKLPDFLKLLRDHGVQRATSMLERGDV